MQRQESVAYFSVDFGDKDIILRGKSYPKGTFATEMLNTDRDTVTKLLSAGVPIFQIFQDLICDNDRFKLAPLRVMHRQ